MCGKFTAMMSWREYHNLAGVGADGGHGGPDMMDAEKMLGTFTPMGASLVLHLGPVRQRRITPMRWGWHDPKATNPLRSFSHLHARSETIEDPKKLWAEHFHNGTRGLVFCKKFNIGEELPNGKTKQWVCSRPDGAPMALAVIYSNWELVGGTLHTFAMITAESCAPLNERDSRMPCILTSEEEIAAWLGETGADSAELKTLLRTYQGALVMQEQEPNSAKPKKPAKPKAKPDPQAELF